MPFDRGGKTQSNIGSQFSARVGLCKASFATRPTNVLTQYLVNFVMSFTIGGSRIIIGDSVGLDYNPLFQISKASHYLM